MANNRLMNILVQVLVWLTVAAIVYITYCKVKLLFNIIK